MAYSRADLDQEIVDIIVARLGADEDVNHDRLVAEMLRAHQEPNLDEFSACCRRLAVSAAAGDALASLGLREEGDVPEADNGRGMPLDRMAEIEAKGQTYRTRLVKDDAFTVLVDSKGEARTVRNTSMMWPRHRTLAPLPSYADSATR